MLQDNLTLYSYRAWQLRIIWVWSCRQLNKACWSPTLSTILWNQNTDHKRTRRNLRTWRNCKTLISLNLFSCSSPSAPWLGLPLFDFLKKRKSFLMPQPIFTFYFLQIIFKFLAQCAHGGHYKIQLKKKFAKDIYLFSEF